jgi:hypothetical protein
MFVCNLFNDAVSVSDCITSNEWMVVNSELERTQKEAGLTIFEALFRNLPGGTDENHERKRYRSVHTLQRRII